MPETRTVVVGEEEAILAGAMEIGAINWVSLAPQMGPFRARVKIRYRNRGELATVTLDRAEPSRARVQFDAPVRAITPGQAAVAYDEATGESVVCGGRILRKTD